MARIPVFDGHNDTLTRLHGEYGPDPSPFLQGSSDGHIDLPRARAGGLVGGFFAIFTRSPGYERTFLDVLGNDRQVIAGAWRVPFPPELVQSEAWEHVQTIIRYLDSIVEQSNGAVAVVRSAEDLRDSLASGTLAIILHIEGAECIEPDLSNLDVLYDRGLRSLGPVWSRPNRFGTGVPFDFPGSPDKGDGLTKAGKELVRRCGELGILVDVSHLNERGFWDVAGLSLAPMVATHSNAHVLCPSPRNLTDRQLGAIASSGGLVGVNFHRGFLRGDGLENAETSYEEIVRHVRYMVDHMGVEHVALGSDFDGATMPNDLPDVAALPTLVGGLSDAGFSESEIRRMALDNWMRVLGDSWKRGS